MTDEVSEGRKIINEVLAKYGFTENDGRGTLKVPLEHTRCIASIYENYKNGFEVDFSGTNVPSARKYYNYYVTDKDDMAKLKTRARNAINKVRKEEERIANNYNSDLKDYKEIHQALVDRQVVFGLNLSKERFGSGAVFKVAGHNLRVMNTNCTVAIRIAGSTVRVPIEKAIEIAQLIPKQENEGS